MSNVQEYLAVLKLALKEGEDSGIAENCSIAGIKAKVAMKRIVELEAENARWVARIKVLEDRLAKVAALCQ